MAARVYRIDYADDILHEASNRVRFRALASSVTSSSQGEPWPEQTSVACWNCDRTFSDPPVGIPRSQQHGVVDVHGTFCSIACVLRYLEEHPGPDSGTQRSWIMQLARDHWGLHLSESCYTAPPRHARVVYGGSMTDAEFGVLVQPTVLPRRASSTLPRRITTPLCVRELYFGLREFGRGESAILEHIGTAEASAGERWVSHNVPHWIKLRWCGQSCSTWPRSSPFLCWHCGIAFTCPPVLIPQRPRNAQGRILIDGNYCSIACGMRELMDSTTPCRPERVGCMMWLARSVYGHSLRWGRFPIAPSRLQRSRFGGDLDDEEFRIQCTVPDLHTSLECPPFLNVDCMTRPCTLQIRDMQHLGASCTTETSDSAVSSECHEELPDQPGLFASYIAQLQRAP